MSANKTLYHSEFVKIGAVTATVKTDVMKSKFAGKPPYVVLEVEGVERNYSCENDDCAEALKGLKGQTVTLEAGGSRDDATITVTGAEQGQKRTEKPATDALAKRATQPTKPAATAKPHIKGNHEPVFGATAGMATVQAVGLLKDAGCDWRTTEFYRELHFVASNIARVSLMIERGELAETAKERNAN